MFHMYGACLGPSTCVTQQLIILSESIMLFKSKIKIHYTILLLHCLCSFVKIDLL